MAAFSVLKEENKMKELTIMTVDGEVHAAREISGRGESLRSTSKNFSTAITAIPFGFKFCFYIIFIKSIVVSIFNQFRRLENYEIKRGRFCNLQDELVKNGSRRKFYSQHNPSSFSGFALRLV